MSNLNIAMIKKAANEEFQHASDEYEACCQMFNKSVIRHYGAALGLADLIEDRELARTFTQSELGIHYRKIRIMVD